MRINNNYKKKLLISVSALSAAILITGGSLTAQAVEDSGDTPQEQSVTYVYHKHIGSVQQEGGCYRTPIYHVHSGNEREYGGCYEIPVYHSHNGDEKTGGDCYSTPVFHEHEGNGESAGGCYRAAYHSHGSDCFRNVPYTEYGCYVKSMEDTTYDDDDVNDFKDYYMSCGEKIHGIDPSHFHKVLECNKENEVEGYLPICGKTEESIEGYLLDCTKTEKDIDLYMLSCNKTTETVEAYGKSCGKDEETPVGKIILTAKQDENHEKETFTAQFEDLTQGEIQLAEIPFTWYDRSGNMMGTGTTMVFYENGNYSVVLDVVNKDVNRDNLRVGLKVDSIVKPTPKEDHSGGSDNDDNDNTEGGENSGDDQSDMTPTPSVTPTASPTVTPAPTLDMDGDSHKDSRNVKSKDSKMSDDAEKRQAIPTLAPVIRKDTRTVKMEEKDSAGEEIPEIKTVEQKPSFLASSVGKLIIITAGSFLLVAGLLALLYLLRRSVRVYNDDGKGNMIYLGRCMVKLEEDGYSVEITDAMAEKAVTNRYCIKPGLFTLFRGEEEELVVIKGQKRVSVSLSKEMIVVI